MGTEDNRGQAERFPHLPEINHLFLNRPSGQLSPRTPPAILGFNVRAIASLDFSSNTSRDNSICVETIDR